MAGPLSCQRDVCPSVGEVEVYEAAETSQAQSLPDVRLPAAVTCFASRRLLMEMEFGGAWWVWGGGQRCLLFLRQACKVDPRKNGGGMLKRLPFIHLPCLALKLSGKFKSGKPSCKALVSPVFNRIATIFQVIF